MSHIGLDAEGKFSGNIPLSTATVGAYITGSGDVPWTAEQIARFHNSSVELINQDNDTDPRRGNVFDCESRAGTIAGAVKWSQGKRRLSVVPVVYIQASNLSVLERELNAGGVHDYDIHLADWNGSRVMSEAMLGGHIRAVQFASPSSNPNMLVPGSHLTLAQANVDVSVCADDFFPAPHPLPAPHGIAVAQLSVDLAAGDWHVQPEPGNIRLGAGGTGRWAVEPLPAEGDDWCAKVRFRRGH